MEKRGISLPLAIQGAATSENRLEKGIQAQTDIFREHMKEAWKAGHINCWMAANCFGDYYTRTAFDLAQREMVTFYFLMAQRLRATANGSCQNQYEFGQCQSIFSKSGIRMPSLYWISPELEWNCLP